MSRELNQGSVSQNSAPSTVFRAEMFGFRRDEVLSCIEKMSSQAQEKQQELEETIASLQETLEVTRHDGELLQAQTVELRAEIEAERLRAEQAVEKAAELQRSLEKANEELDEYRQRLLTKEQEATTFETETQKLRVTINRLNETVSEYETHKEQLEQAADRLRVEMAQKIETVRSESDTVLQAARQRVEKMRTEAETQAARIRSKAEEDARRITAKAEDEARVITANARQEKVDSKRMISDSADNIAASIVVLKSELAAVDDKIMQAKDGLHKVTGNINSALVNAERDLSLLGVQMDKFPVSMPPVQKETPPPVAQPESAPVINYVTNPAMQQDMHAQQRALYTQSNDVFDQQRYAYEQEQQRLAYERQLQEQAHAAQQREIYEREAYERVQREMQEKLKREAYEKQVQEAFEARQREAEERAQREAYEKEQQRLAEEASLRAQYEEQQRLAEEARLRAQYEEQQRLAEEARLRAQYEEQQRLAEEARLRAQYEAQQRLAEEARQRAQYEAQQRAMYYNTPPVPYTSSVSFNTPYQQSTTTTYAPQPQYPQPVYQSPLINNYVSAPLPIAPPIVNSYSVPLQQQLAQKQVEQAAASYAQPAQSAYTPYVANNIGATSPAEQAPQADQKASPVPGGTATKTTVPFEKQQAFSAPKGMEDVTVRKVSPTAVRRSTAQARANRGTLSDALLDGLTNLLNNK